MMSWKPLSFYRNKKMAITYSGASSASYAMCWKSKKTGATVVNLKDFSGEWNGLYVVLFFCFWLTYLSIALISPNRTIGCLG
jgi:hypothetical protein